MCSTYSCSQPVGQVQVGEFSRFHSSVVVDLGGYVRNVASIVDQLVVDGRVLSCQLPDDAAHSLLQLILWWYLCREAFQLGIQVHKIREPTKYKVKIGQFLCRGWWFESGFVGGGGGGGGGGGSDDDGDGCGDGDGGGGGGDDGDGDGADGDGDDDDDGDGDDDDGGGGGGSGWWRRMVVVVCGDDEDDDDDHEEEEDADNTYLPNASSWAFPINRYFVRKSLQLRVILHVFILLVIAITEGKDQRCQYKVPDIHSEQTYEENGQYWSRERRQHSQDFRAE